MDALFKEAVEASLENLAVNIKRVDDTFMEWVNAMNTVEAIEAAEEEGDDDEQEAQHVEPGLGRRNREPALGSIDQQGAAGR